VRVLVAGFMILAGCSSGLTLTSSTTVIATTAPIIVPPDPGIPAVVVSRYGVMGWYEAGTKEWVIPKTAGEVPVTGGEEYQVVSLDHPVTTAIGSGATLCEPSATPVIAFDPQLLGDHRQPGAIAVLATWDLRPQEVSVGIDVGEEHLQAVADVINSIGIDDPDPPITQAVSVDIDGDGADEMLLVAQRVPDDLFGRPGNYSVVLLRRQVEGEWQTAVLETSTGVADSPYVLSHTIPAAADLNGDGKMEIAVDGHYYEGAGSVAYEYINDDLGPVAVLSGGCGA
jgi:FG-GAP-like repeat